MHLTRAQSRAVDEIARDQYRMPTLLLMENAARSAAVVALQMVAGRPGNTLLLIGPGNNGGDGLALGRHLHNAGHSVTLALLNPTAEFKGDAAVNHEICRAMNLPMIPADLALFKAAPPLIVDALFGTGLTRPLTGLAAGLTLATHHAPCPVLALDLPSGLDADSGEPLGPACVVASTTLTFVAPKQGFQNPRSRLYTGDIVVGDIGVPRAAVDAALAR